MRAETAAFASHPPAALPRTAPVAPKPASIRTLPTFYQIGSSRHIFSVTSEARGIAARHDLGFHAVGSGETNARFIMAHRRVALKLALRGALFYALEGKYYGELASGVGLRADIVVMRPDEDHLLVHEDNVDTLMSKICEQVDPRELMDRHVRLLNAIPELGGFERRHHEPVAA